MRSAAGVLAALAFVAAAVGIAVQVGRPVRGVAAVSGPLESPVPGQEPAPEPAADARPRWKPLWSVRFPMPEAIALSPDGRRVVVRDRRNRFTAIDAIQGRTAWTTPPLPRVREMVVGESGAVCCWAPLDPQSDGIVVLDAATGARSLIRVGLPVWSVVLAPGGRFLWVGCGDRTVRRFALSGESGPVATLPGIPDSLAATDRAVYAGMWLDSGLAGVSNEGKLLWTVARSDPARRWRPFATVDGRHAWVVSASGPGRKDPRMERIDPATGTTLWEKTFDGGALRWAVAGSSGWVAVSERTQPGDVAKLHVVDSEGAWRVRGKGSRFLEPVVMAVSARGDRITILDGERGMVTLDDRGRTISRRMTLPKDPAAQVSPRPSRWVQNPDGSRLLVLGDNGVATLYASLP